MIREELLADKAQKVSLFQGSIPDIYPPACIQIPAQGPALGVEPGFTPTPSSPVNLSLGYTSHESCGERFGS